MAEQVLHHERIAAEGSSPRRWLFVLHGVYGAGRNWASLARRVVRERPEWGVLLVDLRQHGGSQGFPPPHTIAAAAEDLERLGAVSELPADAVLGHSFGGKVALAFAGRRPHGLRQLWIIDSTPAAKEPGGSAWNMLDIIRRLPHRFDTRASLISALERHGVERPVAQWMATNLETENGAYTWRFDLDALEALLRDFFETDAFGVVESPPNGLDLHIVRATDSKVLSGAALARIEAAAARGVLQLHEVEGGHWLNVDNPAALVELLSRNLPRS